ncbi:toprim domain-containing protein [Methylobacillus sp.]|uniref:toprim domain-containing protein n=1 Tax=Methylobacillus sp. TaxID=56818 RepID=UPI0012CF3C15|nr:toprim domain-containing protein [Methylobacillus sp.]MPS48569.1 DNA primase [Methylobacillus sp.]
MSGSSLSEILDKLDVEDYLDSEGIEYKKSHGSSGLQLNLMTCPCCGSDKWKVFLNAESGLGNCFSGDCEEKFNKFKFIKAHTGLNGRPLGEYIERIGANMGWRPKREVSTAVNMQATELIIPASFPIPIEGHNLAYLKNRGVTTELAQYFHLRYCDKGWFKYQRDGQDKFMPFGGRVIIPIFDLEGELVSFQGRDITGTAEQKYMFPPGFSVTGKHLYNGHNVIATKRVLLCEGVFDVIAAKAALDEEESLRDVVPIASFGKHISYDQFSRFAELYAKGVREVTFMWDSEQVAIDDAIAAGLELRSRGFNVRIAILPPGKDPNEVPAAVVREKFWGATTLDPIKAVTLKMEIRKRQMAG